MKLHRVRLGFFCNGAHELFSLSQKGGRDERRYL
jgi:hypothetical protein